MTKKSDVLFCDYFEEWMEIYKKGAVREVTYEKQNRCPNSGIISIGNGQYRLLTEKECWRLMGFDDDDYNAALIANPTRKGCTNGSMYKQSGNSIVVNVLEAIFEVVLDDLRTK